MEISFESNEVLQKLPKHLLDLVIDQPYDNYTAQDHAVWRYVMRQNISLLSKIAHKSYLDGLKKTGISIDTIPHMYGMNRILKEIGWAAVAVDGFIPPQAFMEFQAYNILVIAADIRNSNHISYTPAPDIIHEAAGHAPIIADKEYAEYLRFFGEVGSKAFSSQKDHELYEAIRHLSIVKEDPYSAPELIANAEKQIEVIQANMGEPSEMALIRNLHWWTVEYGLIGTVEDFKLYGAGLLSSIGESANCIKPKVKKIAYSIDALNYSFDITTQQPQLFVTPSFEYLSVVLNQFADTMAYRRGGKYGIQTAIGSTSHATIKLSSGIQISGVYNKVWLSDTDEPIYFSTNTPTQLCLNNQVLPGHKKTYHQDGFSSPVGKLLNSKKALEDFSFEDLAAYKIVENAQCELVFESGIKVSGVLKSQTKNEKGQLIILTFNECTVTLGKEELFLPAWGVYDMAIGEKITSASAGLADPLSYGLSFEPPKEKTHKINYDDKAKALHALYQKIRNTRDEQADLKLLEEIFNEIELNHPQDWLAPLEILEQLHFSNKETELSSRVEAFLQKKAAQSEEMHKLINDGLALISKNTSLIHQ